MKQGFSTCCYDRSTTNNSETQCDNVDKERAGQRMQMLKKQTEKNRQKQRWRYDELPTAVCRCVYVCVCEVVF